MIREDKIKYCRLKRNRQFKDRARIRRVIRVFFGFALIRSMIGQQNSRHIFNQCVTRFPALGYLLASDWLIAMLATLVIGQSNYLGFGSTILDLKPFSCKE